MQPLGWSVPVAEKEMPETHAFGSTHWLCADDHTALEAQAQLAWPVPAPLVLYVDVVGQAVQLTALAVVEKVLTAQAVQLLMPFATDWKVPGVQAVHLTLLVALQAEVWLRPEPHVEHAAQGATPKALQVEPTVQGGAVMHVSVATSQMKDGAHVHAVWRVSVLVVL